MSNPQQSNSPQINSPKSARLKWLLRFGVSLLLLGLLITRSHPDEFIKVLRRVPPYVPLLAVLFYYATQCLSVTKWRLLLHARGAQLSFIECARIYILGMFCNLFLPTTIGGDGVRAVVAGRRMGSTTQAASSILVERGTGLAALLTIGAVGVSIWGAGQSFGAVLPRVVGVLLLVALAYLVMRALVYKLEETAKGRIGKILGKAANLLREIDFYAHRDRWGTLAAALAISFIFQSAQVALNIGLARSVGIQTPTTTFLWLVPLLSLTAMVPVPGGLGVREAAAYAILGQDTGPNAVAWSLLYQATVWLSSLPGGLLIGDIKKSSATSASSTL